MRMTEPMKDHFILSLNHCISQFTPPVPPELVQVQFLEVEELGASKIAQTVTQSLPPSNPDAGDIAYADDDDSEAEFQRLLTKEGPRQHLIGQITCPCEYTSLEAKLYLIVIELLPPSNPDAGDIAYADDDDSEAEFQRLLTKEGPRQHLIGQITCPCEYASLEAKLYLIVIEVHKSTDGTIYQNEEGLAYRRRHGSNQMMTINDINIFMHTDRIVE
ncbi:unnamed protein product [Strongylus vulgaris]|uniref:Uncharacterized protein n=1 Tax=Strongylus vulgaris TaxID=40348 RepID=A0A3P7J6D6_STRVU|nr:unnamed protein product [Strongylus vulgaris]